MGLDANGRGLKPEDAARMSRDLADCVISRFSTPDRRVAVGCGARGFLEGCARAAAEALAASGVQAFLFDRPMPAACLSYAARVLQCAAGVMLTAGGCRVYGPDGGRIAADAICERTEDTPGDSRAMTFDEALERGRIAWIPDWVATSYVKEVKRQSLLCGAPVDRPFSIAVATRGDAGMELVPRALREGGYADVTVLADQALPEAMGHASAGLLLAPDADCGRCVAAVKGPEGWRALTGDEAALLLLDYVCQRRRDLGLMPGDPVLVMTDDAPEAAARVAAWYGVRALRVPKGFEHIGRAVARLEAEDRPDSFIFGLDGDGGCLTGRYARERDGVNAALMLCDLFALRGVGLLDRLDALRA